MIDNSKIAQFDFIIFGGAGDLAKRKLLPALYQSFLRDEFSFPNRIFSASRRDMSDLEYREFARLSLQKYVPQENLVSSKIEQFINQLHSIAVDASQDIGWDNLKNKISEAPARMRVFYLAVKSDLFGAIADYLGQYSLIDKNSRIVMEKPIGNDLTSAIKLNDIVGTVFHEDQIFRIDHYLGKETVQNLMALRFANSLYEPLLNSHHIQNIQITVAETIGLEDRIDYYNTIGALRDMVQNHMLQLLCLVAMEPPFLNEANAVRDEKLKVLKALRPIDQTNIAENSVRGQYIAGYINGIKVNSYLDDLGKGPSDTETFVALKANIDNWRWSGTPFFLKTGKRLNAQLSEIVINFKPIPYSIFGANSGDIYANKVVIQLQPDESVKQFMMVKDPSLGIIKLQQISLDMNFASSFKGRKIDAYERLLIDVLRGNQTLFMRRDEVEASWKWIDPISKGWSLNRQNTQTYVAGSAGVPYF